MHCNENLTYVFLFWELRGLSPNFHIYGSVSDLYIPRIGPHTVIRFVWVSAKFGTYTVVSVNVTHVEEKMRIFKGECEHFSFNECPIYTYDGASAKFSTNSQEMDNSAYFLAAE